jgi:DNA-directed RNA polymerase subunit beta
VSVIQDNFRARRTYASIPKVIEIPNLIDIQKSSYEQFLQPPPYAVRRQGEPYISDWEQNQREDRGLHGVFHSVFPIRDFNGTSSLEFVSYRLEKPKYDVQECRSRGMTYAAPLKVTIRLVVWDVTEESDIRTIRDVKEQEVYFGEIPLMTINGTFIVNGTERVIVSQLHRSPGAFFDHDKGKSHASGKVLHSARVIPYRGSWLDFEFDTKDILHVRIDRRRKMPATVLLRALGFSAEELLGMYYDTETMSVDEAGDWHKSVEPELLAGQKASLDVENPEGGRPIVKRDKKFSHRAVKKIVAAGITRIPVHEDDLLGRFIAEDVYSYETGEILLACNDEIDVERLGMIKERGLTDFKVLFIDNLNVGPSFRNTLLTDKIESTDHAIMEIYQRLRPGDPPSTEQANTLFQNLFFNAERYDLSKVGRLKLNHKFYTPETAPPLDQATLTTTDIVEVVRYLLDLKHNKGSIDDIDHLGNRRVRAVGELLENQFRIGLVRMERAIKERMSMSQEIETLMPHDLINAKPVSAVIKEYFGSSQLSQFMDQTNPLGEVTHKRRLSALGPGGLTRDRAGFEVRDVHTTHYGRICPIETPEGPNIGLIASLSSYARVNSYGFIETPYRKVENGVVTGDVRYYSALEEERNIIAQANTALDENGRLTDEHVAARDRGEFVQVEPEQITLMDVSPNQLVSVAASLIPFLENDDANRALMGSNMQRQAVPLLKTRAPLVGTGIERIVARDSGVTTVALHDGVIESVDAGRIVVRRDVVEDDEMSVRPDIYNLTKYQRSNQNTCFNQKPIVNKGDRVKTGDILADGPSTDTGELALGQNLVVAFMPWGGYNFEDSILISERVVKEDVLTSIHIEEFECVARDTKLGKEEITCDIPNVGEEALAHLDDAGIIRIGAEVKHGDILVGKITPKADTQLSPEEKLLRAIFGEKAGDVRDSSLRVPPGVVGTVIGAKVFVRRGADKDVRAESIEDAEEAKILKDQNDEIEIIRDAAYRRIGDLLGGNTTAANLVDENRQVLIKKGTVLDAATLDAVARRYWADIALDDYEGTEARSDRILRDVDEQVRLIRENAQEKIAKLKRGDELPPGVIKMVKVYVAIKRKLQVGDKMAGRHGNKGVVSRLLPEEDMPFLEDGMPVDIVLNPLGVPSRMNVGQVLETHLGSAARYLGIRLNDAIERYRNPDQWPDALVDTLKDKICAIYENDKVQQDLVRSLDRHHLERWIRKVHEGCHIATPVFDGAAETDIHKMLRLAGLPENGQRVLFDGRTGDAFDHDVTVGVMYILKLHHLVDDKIHARSIGPYSLVTQQPLGGKAQFGGQRVGEMEVWAMEAYGAAYSLQEFLTVKSDDVAGRTRMYESIVKGEMQLDAGLPESFNVLIKELHSLCLNVQLLEDVA